jgi:hypothetical protein
MANVLTSASSITCGHEGQISSTSAANLTIDGNPVLIEIGSTVSDTCKLQDSNSSKKCATAIAEGGKAAKLCVDGSPVMLHTVKGTTNGYPPPGMITVDAKQTKLTASSAEEL